MEVMANVSNTTVLMSPNTSGGLETASVPSPSNSSNVNEGTITTSVPSPSTSSVPSNITLGSSTFSPVTVTSNVTTGYSPPLNVSSSTPPQSSSDNTTSAVFSISLPALVPSNLTTGNSQNTTSPESTTSLPTTITTDVTTGLCNFSVPCANQSVYYWMVLAVSVSGDLKNESDIDNWLFGLFETYLNNCKPTNPVQSNGLTSTDTPQTTSATPTYPPGSSLFQGLEVSCTNSTGIRSTKCSLLLKLRNPMLPCCFSRALLLGAQNSSIQAQIVGNKVETVGAGVCGGQCAVVCASQQPTINTSTICSSFRNNTFTVSNTCSSTGTVNISCGLDGTLNVPLGNQTQMNCTSAPVVDNSGICNCSVYCNSTAAYYVFIIRINNTHLNISYISNLNSQVQCTGIVTGLQNCTVIVRLNNQVPVCEVNTALMQVFNNDQNIVYDGLVTRAGICGLPGPSGDILNSTFFFMNIDLTPGQFCEFKSASNFTGCNQGTNVCVRLNEVCISNVPSTPSTMTNNNYSTALTSTTLQPSNSTVLTSTTLQPSNSTVLTSTTLQPSNSTVLTSTTLQPSNSTALNSTTLQPSNSTVLTSTTLQPSNSTALNSTTLQPSNSTALNSTTLQPSNSTALNSTTLQPSNSTALNSTTLQPTSNSTALNSTTLQPSNSTALNSTTLQPSNSTALNSTTLQPSNSTALNSTTLQPTSNSTALNSTTLQSNTTSQGNTLVNATSTAVITNVTASNTSTASREQQANQLLNQTINVSALNSSQVFQLVSELEGLLNGPNVSLALGITSINIVSNLLNASPATLSSSSTKIIGIVDTVGLKLVVQQEASILTQSVALAVKTVDGSHFQQTSFSIPDPNTVQIRDVSRRRRSVTGAASSFPQGSVTFPSTLTSNLSPQQQMLASRLQFNFYQKSTVFQDPALGDSRLNSGILGASVANLSIQSLHDDVIITLRNTEPVPTNFVVSCAFWDFGMNGGSGGWNRNGCNVLNSTDNQTICGCDHLTSFGVLLDISRTGIVSRLQDTILSYITYIGCGISAIFLSVTLLTYLAFGKLRKDMPSKILIQLCLALLFLNLVFLLDSWLALYTNAVGLCISTAWFLHYFLLASFTWMGLEAVHMYIALIKVFNTYISNYMLKFSLVGWGVPLLVVIIVIAVDKNNYGLVGYAKYSDGTPSDDFCWLNNDIAFYAAVVAYFGVIFLFNFVMFIVVMVQLCRIKRQNPQNAKHRSGVQDIRSVVGLTLLLGLTWGFAFFAWGPVNLAFMYLFAIFNSFQGFFIFVFHCAAKENVRRQWRTYLCCGKLRLAENSDWSRTATQRTEKKSISANTRATSLSSDNFSRSNTSFNSSLLTTDPPERPAGGTDGPLDDRTVSAQEDPFSDVVYNEINHQLRDTRTQMNRTPSPSPSRDTRTHMNRTPSP
ncbi:hypothetical protein DPEC_G00239770 [Dallia pectoralis]|uniref:Uncharacterized protein n=1 Tax=Dallia pectoralis TaxID=75939 RepID=A0ACC2FZD8_DALPE|nr:hypothetical protein DPEC_G00239770 [Dallia pectoralis]